MKMIDAYSIEFLDLKARLTLWNKNVVAAKLIAYSTQIICFYLQKSSHF